MATCPDCHGSGECPQPGCNGSGSDFIGDLSHGIFGGEDTCSLCNGSGECITCDGTGEVDDDD